MNRKRTKKSRQTARSRRKRDEPLTTEAAETTPQTADEVRAAGDEIDEILDGFTSPDEATETLGTTRERADLREVSSEEFIRSFRQETGQ